MPGIEARLERQETRPSRIERLLVQRDRRGGFRAPRRAGAARRSTRSVPRSFMQAAHSRFTPPDISVTQILGWTGATARVLATAYLIRLAVDSG